MYRFVLLLLPEKCQLKWNGKVYTDALSIINDLENSPEKLIASAAESLFDNKVFYAMLENEGYDEVIANAFEYQKKLQSSGHVLTSFDRESIISAIADGVSKGNQPIQNKVETKGKQRLRQKKVACFTVVILFFFVIGAIFLNNYTNSKWEKNLQKQESQMESEFYKSNFALQFKILTGMQK